MDMTAPTTNTMLMCERSDGRTNTKRFNERRPQKVMEEKPMLRHRILASVIGIAASLSGLLLLPVKSAAQSFNFVSVDVP